MDNLKLECLYLIKNIINILPVDKSLVFSSDACKLNLTYRYTDGRRGWNLNSVRTLNICMGEDINRTSILRYDFKEKMISSFSANGVNSVSSKISSTTSISDIATIEDTYQNMGINGVILSHGRDFFNIPSVKGPFGVELISEEIFYNFLVHALEYIKNSYDEN